jgi:hypothetical protein
MWVGALGERQLALPPGKGVIAGPLMATALISRSARCPGRSTGVTCDIGVRAAARIVADLGTQLAVDVGMAGRVAGGERNAFDRCGSDAVVDRRETPVGSSDHARHSSRAGATEGSADIDREHGGRGGERCRPHHGLERPRCCRFVTLPAVAGAPSRRPNGGTTVVQSHAWPLQLSVRRRRSWDSAR